MAVIDKEVSSTEETDDGVTNSSSTEIENAIVESSKDATPDAGEEDKEVQDDAGKDGGELPKEEGVGDAVADPNTLISELQSKIAELEERIKPSLSPQPEQPKQVQPLTEEEWSKFEEERGIPRTAQSWVTNTLVRAVTDMRSYIDQKFSGIDKEKSLDSIASEPGFEDAKRYSKEVDQYLAKVDPRFHSHKEVLKDAIIWSRGMNYKNGVQKARNEKEINKRISGVARPSSSGVTKGSSKSSPQLTSIQKSAAAAVNMSEAEYSKLLGKSRVIGN